MLFDYVVASKMIVHVYDMFSVGLKCWKSKEDGKTEEITLEIN